MSWTCPKCNLENTDFIEGVRKTKCLCGYDSLVGDTDPEKNETYDNLSARELYDQAFIYYEQDNYDDLTGCCSALMNRYPNTKEAKLALKKFPITWDGDRWIASYNSMNLPLQWFKFYTYFRIPVSLVIIIISVIAVLQAKKLVAETIIFMSICALFGILVVLVFIGLHKRRLWGWKLNWALIVVEVILSSFGRADDVISFVILLTISTLLWFLPNYIYFNKRRSIFE
jgi:hypothetical protein